MFKNIMLVFVSLSFILTACSPAVTQEVMVDKPTDAMGKPTEVMVDKPTEEMMAADASATPETMLVGEMMENSCLV